MKKLLILSLFASAIILLGCKKSSDSGSNTGDVINNSDVRVTTYSPQDITSTSVVCGGDAIVSQGLSLTEIGVCWSDTGNPSLDDYHYSTTEWDVPYVQKIDGLTPNTKYYIRAYALRGLEYYYGEIKTFTTSNGSITPAPEGAINGLFSISETQKVYFSKGNLQYQASTDTWRFAEHQWDYVGTQTPDYWDNVGGTVSGSDNRLISPTYNGWIDLFGFGTGQNPTNSSTDPGSYYMFQDWGWNTILNGGEPGIWRTLNKNDWNYIINERMTTSGIRFIKAQITELPNSNTINGLILLPDYWKKSMYNFNDINSSRYDCNQISVSNWNTLENAGAVFIPAAGARYGNNVSLVNSHGYLWFTYLNNAWSIIFNQNIIYEGGSTSESGLSVRLVQEVKNIKMTN